MIDRAVSKTVWFVSFRGRVSVSQKVGLRSSTPTRAESRHWRELRLGVRQADRTLPRSMRGASTGSCPSKLDLGG